MNKNQIVGLAYLMYAADRSATRENNYNEMVARLKGHIERWEASIDRLKGASYKIERNIRHNRDRFSEAEGKLQRLDSPASQQWLDRQVNISLTDRDKDRKLAATEKVRDFFERQEKAKEHLDRIESWIREGTDSLYSISQKIRILEGKISDARSKI